MMSIDATCLIMFEAYQDYRKTRPYHLRGVRRKKWQLLNTYPTERAFCALSLRMLTYVINKKNEQQWRQRLSLLQTQVYVETCGNIAVEFDWCRHFTVNLLNDCNNFATDASIYELYLHVMNNSVEGFWPKLFYIISGTAWRPIHKKVMTTHKAAFWPGTFSNLKCQLKAHIV